jgi:transcriptional regulator with XRE-family HTH domain
MLIVDEKSGPQVELAKRIRDVRLELGLNQNQFAAAVGVSTSTASQWESGAFAPRKAMLERISRAVPDRHKAYFLEYERLVRREPAVKNGSEMGSNGREDCICTKAEESDRPLVEELQLSPRPSGEFRWSTIRIVLR